MDQSALVVDRILEVGGANGTSPDEPFLLENTGRRRYTFSLSRHSTETKSKLNQTQFSIPNKTLVHTEQLAIHSIPYRYTCATL